MEIIQTYKKPLVEEAIDREIALMDHYRKGVTPRLDPKWLEGEQQLAARLMFRMETIKPDRFTVACHDMTKRIIMLMMSRQNLMTEGDKLDDRERFVFLLRDLTSKILLHMQDRFQLNMEAMQTKDRT